MNKQDLKNLILNDNFEFGQISKTYLIIKEMLKIDKEKTQKILLDLYIENINNNKIDSKIILIGLFHTISQLISDYDYLETLVIVMATYAIHSEESEILDYGIRMLEQLNNYNSLIILQSIKKPKIVWIAEYLDNVIKNIKENLKKEIK